MPWNPVKKGVVFFVLLTLCLLSSGCAGGEGGPISSQSGASLPPGALLTIDGYAVPEAEFRLFLQDERAMTAAYFGREYGAEVDADFWTRDFGGQTPTDYAKQSALNALIATKMESILLKERGLAEDISYEALMADMADTNAERAEKLQSGEVFYGLTEYDPATYYAYVASNRSGELSRSQYALSTPTEDQLQAIYDENPSLYAPSPSYTCQMYYTDGEEETIHLSSETLGKEDGSGQALYEALGSLTEGDTLSSVSWQGREGAVTLLTADRPEPDFVTAKEEIKYTFAERELTALLQQRRSAAAVAFDQAAYDQISMDGG